MISRTSPLVRLVVLGGLMGLGVLTLVGCSGHDGHSHAAATTVASATTAGSTAAFNDADVKFAQAMIPHHEQAVEMADLALGAKAGAGAKVKDLATRIKAAQAPEIALMKGWLAGWGVKEEAPMGGHHMASMDGMMSDDDMKMLDESTGAAFDKMWLEMMIAHHQGALKMASDVKAGGKSADVAKLADQIVAGQTAEIAEMKALLAG